LYSSSIQAANDAGSTAAKTTATDVTDADRASWEGLPVRSISFEGVSPNRIKSLHEELAQAIGAPLKHENVARSLRQIFATGIFDTVEVTAVRQGDGVALTFRGTARPFIGRNGEYAVGACQPAHIWDPLYGRQG
jgi:outer membrane protein assembly factor BamA